MYIVFDWKDNIYLVEVIVLGIFKDYSRIFVGDS